MGSWERSVTGAEKELLLQLLLQVAVAVFGVTEELLAGPWEALALTWGMPSRPGRVLWQVLPTGGAFTCGRLHLE